MTGLWNSETGSHLLTPSSTFLPLCSLIFKNWLSNCLLGLAEVKDPQGHLLTLLTHQTHLPSLPFIALAAILSVLPHTQSFLPHAISLVCNLPQHPAHNLQPSRTRKPSRTGCTCLVHALTHQPLRLRVALPYLALDDRQLGKRVLRELVRLWPWFPRQDKKLLEGRGWVFQFSGLPKTGLCPQWVIKAADCLTGGWTGWPMRSHSAPTRLYNHDICFSHCVVLAPPTSHALLCLSASAYASFWNVIFPLLYVEDCY